MNVKKLMVNMKQRDDFKQEKQDLRQKLRKKSVLLNTVQSAFEETESNIYSGREMQNQSVGLSVA